MCSRRDDATATLRGVLSRKWNEGLNWACGCRDRALSFYRERTAVATFALFVALGPRTASEGWYYFPSMLAIILCYLLPPPLPSWPKGPVAEVTNGAHWDLWRLVPFFGCFWAMIWRPRAFWNSLVRGARDWPQRFSVSSLLGRPLLLFVEPADCRAILCHTDDETGFRRTAASFFWGAEERPHFLPGSGRRGVSFLHGAEHWRVRHALFEAFNGKEEGSSWTLPVAREVARAHLHNVWRWQRASHVDVRPLADALVFEATWDVLLGRDRRCHGPGDRRAFEDDLRTLLAFDSRGGPARKHLLKRFLPPNVARRLPGTALWKAVRARDRLLRTLRRASCAEQQQPRRPKEADPECVLDRLIASQRDWLPDGEEQPDARVAELVLDLFLASQAPCVVSMCWAVQLLGARPKVATRIREEHATWCAESSDCGSESGEFVKGHPFARAVAFEVLRHRAPVSAVSMLAARDVELRAGRLVVPQGALVVASLSAACELEAGSDGDDFRPERFFAEKEQEKEDGGGQPRRSSPERRALRPKGLVFGTGAHACPGQRFALELLSCFLVHLCETLTWELAPRRPKDHQHENCCRARFLSIAPLE